MYKTGSRTTDPESQTTTKKPITFTSSRTDPDNQSTTNPTASTEIATPKATPCINTFKAVLLHRTTEQTYIFNGNLIFVLGKRLGMTDHKDPIPVYKIFKGLQSVDALYYNKKGEIVVFSGLK